LWGTRDEGAGGDAVNELREEFCEGEAGGHTGVSLGEGSFRRGKDFDAAFSYLFGGVAFIGALAVFLVLGQLGVGGTGHRGESIAGVG
jgi:hypothetical protein